MELDDPYTELGLTADASDAEVKAAWRRLSARWHPDRNPSPQALLKIQRINRAVESIRSARAGAGDGGDAAPAPDAAGEADAPIAHAITLSLEEAASGCIRSIHGEIACTCSACGGSGEAAEPVACTHCGGQGRVHQPLWFGWLATAAPCEACEGEGRVRVPCASCDGSGQAEPLTYRSRVRIPPGVRDGYLLHARVKLQGRAGHQAIEVRIRLQPHAFMSLQTDGAILMEVPVDGFAWIAGRWVEVPTLDGPRPMRLQRGALTYRIRNAGFPSIPSGPRADCLVSVIPLFPDEWDGDQDALLNALIRSNTGDATSEAGARAAAWNETVAAWRKSMGRAGS